MLDVLTHWKQVRKFKKSKPCDVVFYSEDTASYVYLGPIVEQLLVRGLTVAYLTSDANDPLLMKKIDNLYVYDIGAGVVRTALFMLLNANILVMTMPDLETFHIKRSKGYDVHYVYVFHSLVSTHRVYRERAFDSFDSILCAGPHQIPEIRESESLRSLPRKNLIEHGYGRLDSLVKKAKEQIVNVDSNLVLVAPSWGENCIIDLLGEELIAVLIDSGFDVILRPHPVTVRTSGAKIDAICKRFASASLVLETDVRGFETFERSCVMISDWSGVAFEYALAYKKPVVFIDSPGKANNPNWRDVSAVPIEEDYRSRIGAVVKTTELEKLPDVIRELNSKSSIVENTISKVRDELVFNIGSSDIAAADFLEKLARDSEYSGGLTLK